jgi:hypothetical protein
MASNALLKISLRAFLAWSLLAVAGFVFVRPILAMWSPMMESVIDAMQSDFTAQLSVVDMRGAPTITMLCTATRELRLPSGRVVPFLGSYQCATTDAVHALVPIVIFLVTVVSWPIGRRAEVIGRILSSFVLLPFIVAATTPMLLLGLVNSVLNPASFSTHSQWTALLQPFVFMEMGGRWLLPLVAALLCVRFGTMVNKRPKPAEKNIF